MKSASQAVHLHPAITISRERRGNHARLACLAGMTMATLPLCGCIVVGASSRGGFFFWPGGLGLLVVALVFFLLLRRR